MHRAWVGGATQAVGESNIGVSARHVIVRGDTWAWWVDVARGVEGGGGQQHIDALRGVGKRFATPYRRRGWMGELFFYF